MATPLLLSALVGASVSFLVAVLFNSLNGVKGEKKGTDKYPHQDKQVWE